MRSKESPIRPTQEAAHHVPNSRESNENPRKAPNAEFGALVEQAAIEAGYDMAHGRNGRTRLAKDAGMSFWAIGRIISGDALPKPENFQRIAAAVGRPTRDLLIAAGILPADDTPSGDLRPNDAKQVVRSVTTPVSPDTAADLLGVSHPMVRPMLIANMRQALSLQQQFDERGTDEAAAQQG
ncbi:helix-turn-helix transcriptional regulator [Streptomyces sp. NPDC047070]|uniref:helix-turn-helix domain-containing protein n=1 Tax=Streptomyces sp. NPDC047070 TaxID=3154923 RepID=UPI0034565DD3